MNIIGREEEKQIFQELLDSPSSEFLAVYGRRRIGKTYLIENYYEHHMVFHHIALTGENNEEITMAEQLDNFWLTLNEYGYSDPKPPTSWLTAFQHLNKYISSLKTKKKKVIFIDEIPWMDTPRSLFLTAFGNFWNKYCAKRSDILLVICGSAASWIIKKVVMNPGGLHNRLTRTVHLQPFTLNETNLYLTKKGINLVDKDLALLYMCVGGVPYYLNGVKKGKSINAILHELFFSKNAYLKNEFEKLFKSLFKKYETHLKIIRTLGTKKMGLTRQELISVAKLDSGGGLTTALDELSACGFIYKMNSFGKKSKDVLYRLIDEYSQFYLQFQKSESFKVTQNLASTQAFKIWSGFAFENLCIRHIDEIVTSLGISGINYSISSLILKGSSKKGAQIDLIIDRSDNCINLIEIKFHSTEFIMNDSQFQNVMQKVDAFQAFSNTRKNIFVTLVTASKTIKNKYYLGAFTNEVSLEKLIH
jgi:uncharacterized protein